MAAQVPTIDRSMPCRLVQQSTEFEVLRFSSGIEGNLKVHPIFKNILYGIARTGVLVEAFEGMPQTLANKVGKRVHPKDPDYNHALVHYIDTGWNRGKDAGAYRWESL